VIDKPKLYSMNRLAKVFSHNPRTVERALRDVPPDGVLGRFPAWTLATATGAMRDYADDSAQLVGRTGAGTDNPLAALMPAADRVDAFLKGLRAEPDVERRRAMLRREGRVVGELEQVLEAVFVATGPECPALMRPWLSEQLIEIMSETLALCEMRFSPDAALTIKGERSERENPR
jgi:hypothetical protein